MRPALACAGILLAGVLVPGAVLADYVAPQAPGDALTPYSAAGWGPEGSACLQAHALSGVAASNKRVVILRFGSTDFYRVRLTKDCPALLGPGTHVASVTRSTGGNICRAFDVELTVVAGDGAVSHCTGGALHRMSTAEVAAVSTPARPLRLASPGLPFRR